MFIARFMNTCERIFSEGQARLRTGCRPITEEQMAKVRIINEKYKNHHFNIDAPYLYLLKKIVHYSLEIWYLGGNEEAHP